MVYQVVKPPPHLAGYVKFFWFAEANASTQNPYVHHAFAYPCPEFIFCYKGSFRYQAGTRAEQDLSPGVYGQTESFSKVFSQNQFGVFGFYLYPHALPELFRVPASEITNQCASLRSVCGEAGKMLEEDIMCGHDNQQRIALVCRFLENRLHNCRTENKGIIASLMCIAKTSAAFNVKTFAQHNFLSVRQFERRCKELSGFTPKTFLRITRFNALLDTSFSSRKISDIAYDYGYSDPAHFSRDFRNFSGCNPSEYFNHGTLAASDRGTLEFSL